MTNPLYLNPTTADSELPLDHKEGHFQYLRRIRDNLESALSMDFIPARDMQIKNPPSYIRDLAL